MNSMLTIVYYLYSLFFGIICYSLIIRIGIYICKISSLHQVSQLIHTLTNPLVNLSKMIYNFEKKRTLLPLNVVLTLVIVVTVKYIIADFLFYGGLPISYLLIIICADLIVMPINLLFVSVLIRAIMSWVRPDWRHPVNDILFAFTEPLLKLGRFVLPNLSGFDFSPLLVIVILHMLSLFIYVSLPIRLL